MIADDERHVVDRFRAGGIRLLGLLAAAILFFWSASFAEAASRLPEFAARAIPQEFFA